MGYFHLMSTHQVKFAHKMSLQALAQEKFWANKAECEDAEKAYHMRLSGAKVDNIAAKAGGVDPNVLKKINDLEIENKNLKKVTEDLLARVAALEISGGAPKAAAPKAPSKKEEKVEDDDDEEVDLFGSDSDSEDDAEKARVTQERLAAYHAKKAKKPKLIAKTSVVLDIKPWDDETDMDAMLKTVKTIVKEGLLWGASKLVPVGYGINKLRVMCVVEDEKVSIDELCEQIAEFEDFVQSVDIDSMSKI